MDRLHPLAGFDAGPRLYRLEGEGDLSALHVEAWVGEEALDEPFRLEVCCLAGDPRLALTPMLGRTATLVTRLPDGREHRRSARVDQAIAEDCDGSLARYRLVLRPWPWFLSLTLRSQAWQDRSAVQIVDSLLGRHAAWARWRWTRCAVEHLARASARGLRPHTVQYRESDLDFILRLLAEEGIGCRTDADGGLVLFGDSRRGCFEDFTSARAPLAFQHADAQEGADTLQALQPWSRSAVGRLTTLGYHEEVGHAVAAGMEVEGARGAASRLESCDAPGAQAFTTRDQATRTLGLVRQAIEARRAGWSGQGSVRSFTAGTTFRVDAPLPNPDGGAPLRHAELLLTRVRHVGLNNLPAQLGRALLERFGPEPVLPLHAIEPALLATAAQRGYANHFEAIRAGTP